MRKVTVNGYRFTKYQSPNTIRWELRDLPIPVFIAPFHWHSTEQQGRAQLYRDMVLKAMTVWESKTRGLVRFKEVPYPSLPGLDIRWSIKNRHKLGWCSYENINNGCIKKAVLDIHIPEETFRDNRLFTTILHEFGHALGLAHTANPEDVMFGAGTWRVRMEPSENELETLRILYNLPPNFPYEQWGRELGLSDPLLLDNVLQALWKEFNPAAGETLPSQAIEPMLKEQFDFLETRGRNLIQKPAS